MRNKKPTCYLLSALALAGCESTPTKVSVETTSAGQQHCKVSSASLIGYSMDFFLQPDGSVDFVQDRQVPRDGLYYQGMIVDDWAHRLQASLVFEYANRNFQFACVRDVRVNGGFGYPNSSIYLRNMKTTCSIPAHRFNTIAREIASTGAEADLKLFHYNTRSGSSHSRYKLPADGLQRCIQAFDGGTENSRGRSPSA